MAKKRKMMGRQRSRRDFTAKSGTHRKNVRNPARVMRGGIRL